MKNLRIYRRDKLKKRKINRDTKECWEKGMQLVFFFLKKNKKSGSIYKTFFYRDTIILITIFVHRDTI